MIQQRGNVQGGMVRAMIALAVTFLLALPAWAGAKRYIVTFKSQQTFQSINKSMGKAHRLGTVSGNSDFNLLNTKVKPSKSFQNLGMLLVESDKAGDIEALRRHPAIADVEEEIFFKAPPRIATVSSNAALARQAALTKKIEMPWGISAVKAPEAWTVGGKGAGARVLILDTGIDKDHPDVASRFETGKDFAGRIGQNVPYDYFDDIGHGTHVAGTVLADGEHSGLVGVAPEAKFLAGRVCSDRGCSSVAIIEGVDWGISQKVDVISMSLGGPFPSRAAREAYARAEAANVVVVAASGNDGAARVSYPAAYDTVVAVGAVNPDLTKADFSNWGPQLDIVAPGVDVVSSVPVGTGRESLVQIDMGNGELVEVKSMPMQGSPELTSPVKGGLVFAGLGKPEDFKSVNVSGKFALIQRGEIKFADKVTAAINAGATGVVIFNNEAGLIRGGLTEDGSEVAVPVVMIEQTVGEELKKSIDEGAAANAVIETLRTDHSSYQGTSMATPHVSGVVALIRRANPDLNPAEVREVLTSTATPLSPNTNNEFGRGLVNAEAAVMKAGRHNLRLAGSF